MPQTHMYTQEQLEIALLKNTQEGILRSIDNVAREVHSLRNEMREDRAIMHQEIKSQWHWNMGLILGIYALIGASMLGKIFGVL